MRKILISTDQICDLPQEYLQKNNILMLPLSYSMAGVEYDGINTPQLPTLELFERMKKGQVAKTSQTNPEVAKNLFLQKIEEGFDIFHISTSSGISGTYDSVMSAVEDLKKNKETLITKQNQNFDITVVNSITGAGGEAMLIDKIVEFNSRADKTLKDLKQEIDKLIPKVCHYFTLDDLNYLARGGRISKKRAVVGSILQVKPLLYMNKEGKLVQIGQALGRKKSIRALVDLLEKKLVKEENQKIFISHGDCLSDVEILKEEITKRFDIKEFIPTLCSPIVAAHTGPGAIGVFCFGKDRDYP